MKRIVTVMVVSVCLIGAQDTLQTQVFEYIGSGGCKACHSSSKKGAQYKIWAEGVHAKAFETLKTEEAEKIAKEKGLKVPASEAPECINCHTTGFGKGGYEVKDAEFWNPPEDDRDANRAVKRMAGLQGVGCEACHGPGSEYKSKKTMEAVFTGTLKGESVGLIKPTEEVCTGCHNENSPVYKPFKYEERVKEIAHPYPPDVEK